VDLRRLLLVLGGAATLVLSVGLAATPASALTRLGGVDIQRSCDAQFPGQGMVATVTDRQNAYSWRCVKPGVSLSVDLNRGCATQYWAGAYAGLGSTSDPYSWFCQGPICHGAGCVHRDPGVGDCGGSNGRDMESVTARGGGATISLKWSAYCTSNWARWVTGVSDPGYWNYWVETIDGHGEGKTFNQSVWTFMANGELAARACIQGNFDPTPACTGWH